MLTKYEYECGGSMNSARVSTNCSLKIETLIGSLMIWSKKNKTKYFLVNLNVEAGRESYNTISGLMQVMKLMTIHLKRKEAK